MDVPANTSPAPQTQHDPTLRFAVWAVGSVLLALTVDLLVREAWPEPPYWLDMLVFAGVTLPMLWVGSRRYRQRLAEQEAALNELLHRRWVQARTDPLTGLGNRRALFEAAQALRRAHPSCWAALFVLDLHDFQRINDSCGHAVGDEVLRHVSQRLRTLPLALPTLAGEADPAHARSPRLIRAGSDELALWLPDWPAEGDPTTVAEALLGALQAPVTVERLRLHLRGNVGYVVARAADLRPSEWLTRASTATREAKRLGSGRHRAFEAEMTAALVRRHTIIEALQDSVHTGTGLWLQYQPIVTTEGQRLVGCEALLRWRHPQWGPVSPAEFIPIAESSDLIRPLGRWVLERAVTQLAEWQRCVLLDGEPFKVSVNLSRAQLHDPELVPFLQGLLRRHAVWPNLLRLEVTESQPWDDPDCVRALHALQSLGVTIALDDFGTGYSSLSALLNLPLRSVKIDRQFIDGIDTCPNRQALVASVVHVAQALRLEVVAEGVEQAEQAQTLRLLGCRHIQGWFVGRPQEAEVFTAQWLLPRMAQAAARAGPAPASAGASSAASPECAHRAACTLPRFGQCAPSSHAS